MADLVTTMSIRVQDQFSGPLQDLYDKLESIRSALNVPDLLAKSFESGLDRVSVVLSEITELGKDAETSMGSLAGAAQDMAASIAASSKPAALTESLSPLGDATAGVPGSALADSLETEAAPAVSHLTEKLGGLGSGLLDFGKDIFDSLVSTGVSKALDDFDVLEKLSGGFKALKGPLGAMKSGVAKIIPTMVTWAVANWSALWPILLIIAGIAALVAIVILVVKYWEPISAFFADLWESIKEIFSSVWEWIKGFFANFKDFFVGIFSGIWEKIQTAFSGIWEGIKQIFSKVWEFLKKAFEVGVKVLLWIVAPIPMLIIKYWEPITQFFVGLWEGIKEIFSGVWEWITGFLDNFKNFFAETFSGIWEGIKGVFSGVKDFFVEIFSSVWEWLGGFFENIVAAVSGLVSLIAQPFKAIGDFFGRIFGGSKNAGSELIDTMAKGAAGNTALEDALGTQLSKTGESLPDPEAKRDPSKTMGGLFRRILGASKNGGSKLIDTMAEGAAGNTALHDSLYTQFSKTGELLPESDAKRGPFAHLSDSGRSIPQTMAEGVEDKKHTLSQKLSTIFSIKQESNVAPREQRRMAGAPRATKISIENLVVQASEIEDLSSFMRILESASGYKRSYA